MRIPVRLSRVGLGVGEQAADPAQATGTLAAWSVVSRVRIPETGET